MIRLEYTKGSSNKYYELNLEEKSGIFTVAGFYGAIGKAPRMQPIYIGTDRKEAERAMEKKRKEKIKKGYVKVKNNDSIPQKEKG
jgi:predicted DNA-binding WGR domain protein